MRYERWEKGDVDRHGKGNNSTQNRLQLLNKSLPRADFINMFVQEMAPFTEHVQRARVQYQAVRTLRESLQPGEVTCQMDFVENWNTDQLNQVQSAYFDHAWFTSRARNRRPRMPSLRQTKATTPTWCMPW